MGDEEALRVSASPEPKLADLRTEIDRIDSAMHELLIERGRIIDTLIEIKARQGGGSAFRPAREASMMRALAERHRGRLPLDTVESIWRVIIATFTYIQAPYSVHLDVSRGEAAIRDSARFHFGFTVPCVAHRSAAAVIGAVAELNGDLGMFALDGGPGSGAWWTRLTPPHAPKVIARLPFVERADHPAGMPVFVVSKPLADGAARDVVLDSDHARSVAARAAVGLANGRWGSHRVRGRWNGSRPARRPTGRDKPRGGSGGASNRRRRRCPQS